MAEQQRTDEVARALAGIREELRRTRTALERLLAVAVVALVLGAILGLIVLSQTGRATSVFG